MRHSNSGSQGATAAGGSEGEGEEEGDLSDMDVDDCLLSAEETALKERVWTEMNADYLDAQAIRTAQRAAAAEVCCRTVTGSTCQSG